MWVNSKKEGFGTFYWPDLKQKYIGDFKKDRMDGFGSLYNTADGKEEKTYEGNFKEGKKNGWGLIYQNGKQIEGNWDAGADM